VLKTIEHALMRQLCVEFASRRGMWRQAVTKGGIRKQRDASIAVACLQCGWGKADNDY